MYEQIQPNVTYHIHPWEAIDKQFQLVYAENVFLFCSIILKSRHCHQNETSSTALTLKAKHFITVNSFTFMQHTFHTSLSNKVDKFASSNMIFSSWAQL